MSTSRKVKALGEIVLRTENVDAMFEYYRDVVELVCFDGSTEKI